MIATLVSQRNPATRAEVDAALGDVRNRPEVKALLKAQIANEMGPEQPAGQTTPADADTPVNESAEAAATAVLWS
jgi:hypothetical protein